MRRPLALFGCSFLLTMLAVLRLPFGLLLAALGVAALAFVAALLLVRKRWGGALPLVLAALVLALGWRAGYDALRLRPVQALAGETCRVSARVLETEPGYGDDTVHATLQVTAVEGRPELRSFRVKVYGLPEVRVGEAVSIQLRFSAHTAAGRTRALGNGLVLNAAAVGAPQRLGESHTFLTRMRQLQYAAGAQIGQKLPHRLAGVMAAMTVGDRRGLDAETTEAYRAAGISHLLVVSGLHLSILCGPLAAFVARGGPRRRRIAAVAGVLLVSLFIAFTGFTPSVVRGGVAWILVFAAGLFRRRADILTSLGFAATLLVLQNPYAAADVGLWLSFTATLGALGGGALQARLRARWRVGRRIWPLRAAFWLLGVALVSLCVTLATLPVLAAAGMGISLLALPGNLVAVPLINLILPCGFLLAIPAGWPVLGLLGLPASVLGGGLLVLLEWLTGLAAALPGAYIPLGGLFGFVVVAVFYLLGLMAVKTRRVAAFALVGALLVPLVVLLHTGLSAGTVKVLVAGNGPTSSVVVIRGRQAVVLYRSRQSARQVAAVLRQNRAGECLLLVDMRRGTISDDYTALYAPGQVVVAKNEILSTAVYHPFADVEITVAQQAGGTVACVDVAGYRVGLCTGAVNLELYARLDVLVAGSGRVQGSYGALLVGGALPAWAHEAADIWVNEGGALVWIRPGRSVRIREVQDGVGGG